MNDMEFYGVYRRQSEKDFLSRTALQKISKLAEEVGLTGWLFFESNATALDPWIATHEMMALSDNLSPIVALNPLYMHPFAAAKKIVALSRLYNRKMGINFIAGTSLNDMLSLGYHDDHDLRYQRLSEYIQIVKFLINESCPLFFDGKYYSLKNIQLPLSLKDSGLCPDFYLAGSSDKALEISKETGCIRMQMATPDINSITATTVHYGLWARQTMELAEESIGEVIGRDGLEKGIFEAIFDSSDSIWKKQLYSLASFDRKDNYSLLHFSLSMSDCPYFFGTYQKLAAVILDLTTKGIKKHIIEFSSEEEFLHVKSVLEILKNNTHRSEKLKIENFGGLSF